MNATWIGLSVAVVMGLTKLITYLLSDKRKLAGLIQQLEEKEKEYAQALAKNDTATLSILDVDMRFLRKKIASLKK